MELFVFYTSLEETSQYLQDGADGSIIDWENQGKEARQKLFDTQINLHNADDLIMLKEAGLKKPIICRVNQYSNLNTSEIDSAINNGANEILLPMVRNPGEVETVLKIINERCPLGILIETREAVKNAEELGKMPLSRVFVGLNDLAIDSGYSFMFEPVFDGTIQKIRSFFPMQFGFGGLTHPSFGSPVPCRILINEMKKHNCTFSFLRRSFFRDSKIIASSIIVSDIQEEFKRPIFTYPENEWINATF